MQQRFACTKQVGATPCAVRPANPMTSRTDSGIATLPTEARHVSAPHRRSRQRRLPPLQPVDLDTPEARLGMAPTLAGGLLMEFGTESPGRMKREAIDVETTGEGQILIRISRGPAYRFPPFFTLADAIHDLQQFGIDCTRISDK